MFEFCVDVYLYFMRDPKNVIGVHCKAGKGRTGMMICAFLIFTEMFKNTEQALHFYGSRRTTNGKGVTIASQVRYITYFERLLKERCVTEYPKIVIDFMKDPIFALEKYVPLNNKKNLRVINIGPFYKDRAFGFHVQYIFFF
jgi:phosphatidylinositol-3,4,5-trisphosphate 3-phosphatase/dual-specificity protein phosphatase PTEN